MNRYVNCLTICAAEVEGFGTNFLLIISAYALSQRLGCYYTLSPLKNVLYSTTLKYGHDAKGDKDFNDYILNCLLPSSHVMSLYGQVRYINNIANHNFPAEPEGELGGEHIVNISSSNSDNAIDGTDIEYINVSPNIEAISKILAQPQDKNRVVRIFGTWQDLFSFSSEIFARDPSLILNLRNELMENYRKSSHTPSTYYNNDEINIAIHTRRFCSPPDNIQCRNLPEWMFFSLGSEIDQFYCSLVKELSKKLSSRATCFHFYGHSADSSQIADYDHFIDNLQSANHRIETHINESPIATLHHFILADILVMARSSFSYSAHFYSRGPVLVHNRFLETYSWTKKLLPHVYSVDNDGKFDDTILTSLLVKNDL